MSTDRHEYRNIQVVRGGRAITPGALTEEFAGDGTRRTFVVSLPVGRVPDVYVRTGPSGAFVKKTTGFQSFERNEDAQWFWTGESNEITQNDDEPVLTSDDLLRVVYHGLHYVIVERSNGNAITERRDVEGGTGRYEHVYVDSTLRSADAVRAESQALLDRHSNIPIRLRATTFRVGLDVGQSVSVRLPEHGIEAPTPFLIESVSRKKYDSTRVLTTINAVSTTWLGEWEALYRAMLQKRDFVETGDAERFTVAISTPTEVVVADDAHAVTALTENPADPVAIVGQHRVGFRCVVG